MIEDIVFAWFGFAQALRLWLVNVSGPGSQNKLESTESGFADSF